MIRAPLCKDYVLKTPGCRVRSKTPIRDCCRSYCLLNGAKQLSRIDQLYNFDLEQLGDDD